MHSSGTLRESEAGKGGPVEVMGASAEGRMLECLTGIAQNPEKVLKGESNTAMTSSVASILDDTTPSDSGVHLLDSESSELNESIMSSSGFDFDGASAEGKVATQAISEEPHVREEEKAVPGMTKSDIENSNLPADAAGEANQIPDEMVSSTCSTFDTDAIVYRRRVKKGKSGSQNAPKKRVSFHEDILKNTKTDNIHIEHGFITYKGAAAKKAPHMSRYSWCSEGDGDDMNENSQYVYRNACSDVLDYGKTDIYENPAGHYIPYDNSGIFEYGPQYKDRCDRGDLYRCQCSDSNSSLESNEADDRNSNQRRNYQQAKSSSCDCIGGQNNNGPVITENCYFSEPSMDTMPEGPQPKSVWNKERKPKTSCLKKTTKHTDIIQEHDLNGRVKKFNVHQLPEVNNFIDSKTIFGSLKNIFSIPLPERGVPEGSEDLQSVCECIPEADSRPQSPVRPRPFLSKSLDQGLTKKQPASKKYIHNVDEQLRRKNDADLYAPSVESRKNSTDILSSEISQITDTSQSTQSQYRNKFIINCESTVFEHTGVSYEAQDEKVVPLLKDVETDTTSFLAVPFTRKLTNIFRGFKESPPKPDSTKSPTEEAKFTLLGATADENTPNKPPLPADVGKKGKETKNPGRNLMESSITSHSSDRNSTISDITSLTSSTAPTSERQLDGFAKIFGDGSPQHSRHLASPVRKKSLTTRPTERPRMSPDLFNSGRESKNSLLSEEFDDILTITTDASDKNDSDMVIVDYPDVTIPDRPELSDFFKPATSKTSLINRFLRHVTQKKILDATIKRNQFFLSKMSAEKKVCGNLYVKGVKPRNQDLIEDLNAEIALEIEMSGYRQGRRERCELSRLHMDVGVGEVSVEIFNGNCLHILRNESELLMKVFKLYTGYNRDGHMTPVLVFLTDKTLYVTDLVRNRLCNKFVLPYSELDVILMGPYGNTVLLCNGARDMQQVLLAGGPYPADGLVSSLEICARRGGSILPAVGQLTLDHLAPLQAFVRDNSSIPKGDAWQYYAVVNVPAVGLSLEKEPLGPYVKGPLMHRNLGANGVAQPWHASYFLLKAGVLYMFSDAGQKIPSWAIALTECQGARRAVNTTRPHCFELMLRTGTLQLAAPDEYVASEWLQALVQSASGLFEMQERHATLGCTLIMTSNHLITMREDFAAPLRRINVCPKSPSKENIDPNGRTLSPYESSSEFSSTLSTPTKGDRRSNSTLSTPVRNPGKSSGQLLSPQRGDEKSYSSMSSFYGKNSGVEILTCAAIDEMVALKIPLAPNNWWCVLEFSCQEVRENSDDLVIFFATNSEMRRFLSMLERMWQVKREEQFPVSLISDEDSIGEHCTKLFAEINKSWEPLLSAALGYPQ